MDLTGKTALITGSSRGIGREIAIQFAKAGARVALHYHQRSEEVEGVLAELMGTGHCILQGNVADPRQVKELFELLDEKMPALDILVNNAGIYHTHSIIGDSYEAWQQSWHETLGINLLGPAYLIHQAVKRMLKTGGGRILNISSRGAFRGEPDAPAYGAAKAGLNALSQSMARALAPKGVMVYTIAPGFVDTEMAAPILAGPQGDSIRSQSPLNRVADPLEIARTALFLVSDETEYLTGCIIDANGASYLRT
ncbi:MAG: SDR family oxidoreductase [FCB group bacterium]|nr:SDR family oxidoreductase [FCB group bacterium]